MYFPKNVYEYNWYNIYPENWFVYLMRYLFLTTLIVC